ncbi:WXG100 family type VII secretion target [Actinomadura atramentaria]|uniref:WXG100 family type VII secretion target n=1 Tax=Actinomadura atramentaria TaxID=1990 RepID=UPI00037603C6|nr:type VII secretion target [Actinomadura atramentaria]
MTVNGFEVDPSRLRASASELRAVADRLQQALSDFEATVDGFGQPWGADDIGSIIGMAHDEAFDTALDCFTTNADDLAEYAEALTQMADNYVEMEQSNELYVNRIGEVL